MKKKLITFIFLLFLTQMAFWSSDDTINDIKWQKTLKELKNNIEDLKEEKINLNEKIQLLIEENWELKSFFKQNLTLEDLNNIKNIIYSYNTYGKTIEEDLKTNAKNLESSPEEKKILLNEKSDAYKKLIPFIDESKKDNYLEFVKWDLIIFKEKWDINEKIYLNEEVLTKKVEDLKEKIVKNKEIIDDKIEKVITDKTLEKINFLKNSESFNKLKNSQKKEIILKIIDKIKSKVSILEKDWQKYNLSYKKIEMYNLTLLLLNSFYKEFN